MIGYLSAAVEWAANRGTPDAWRDWWQNPEAEHYYFMGKDNIVFHTVIWPSMLLGYGDGGEFGAGRGELNLPDNIVASEFLTMEGKKFASSRGVGIYVNDFLDRYDPDPLRYFLTAAGPETQDTDFTWAEFVRRNNDELLATWGNLVNRTLTNAHKNFAEVPQPAELTGSDRALLDAVEGGFGTVGGLIDRRGSRRDSPRRCVSPRWPTSYLSEQEPWAVLKSDRQRAATILYIALRAVDSLNTLLAPFLPFSAQSVHTMLGYDGELAGPLDLQEVAEDEEHRHVVLTGDYEGWVGSWKPSALPPGQELREPRPLFRKLDPEQVVSDELERMRRVAGEA